MKLHKLLPVCFTLFATDAFAEGKWGIGLGAISQDEGYIGIGRETNLVPVIFYQSEDFYILGPRFGYEVGAVGDLEFSLVGQYRFDGYEVADGDIFNGMEDRKGSFDLGVEMEYETDLGDFGFEFITDATSEHKGQEMSVSYSLPFILQDGSITPYVALTHLSNDLVDYYYGVRANEATSTRAFYEGKSTTNVEMGIQSRWNYGENHLFVVNASVERVGSEIKDSPLVDSSTNTQFILGYVYVF